MGSLMVPIVLLVIMLIGGAVFFVVIKRQEKKASIHNDKINLKTEKKVEGLKRKNESVPKEDIFKFMEFEKIIDDMIVQNKGTKFTMVIKCKGINYDLMSEVEQLSVEEGFITFLNTLRFPIQLYVQVQNIDLKKNVKLYNDRVEALKDQFDQANEEYNYAINSLDSSDEDIAIAEYNKRSIQNVMEYASDITKYVERLSLNKNLLQRNFYVLVSYHSSEITSAENFSKEEILDICYNELYTRAYSIISALSACSVTGKVLTSNEVAELLYTSYNRDDKNYMNIKDALDSGFYRLYSTSIDAFEKKNQMLEEEIKRQAKIKAYEAIQEAIKSGRILTPEQQEDDINREISEEAVKIVKEQRIDDDLKDKAKKVIVEDYKEKKKKNMKKAEEREKQAKEKKKVEVKKDQENDEIISTKKENPKNEEKDIEIDIPVENIQNDETKQSNNSSNSSDDMIV